MLMFLGGLIFLEQEK